MTRAARLLPLMIAAALTLPVPVAAQSEAVGPVDGRIMTRVYDEGAVVTIRGKVKVQTTIKFAEDEQIENVAIGDSGAWQVQPNKAQSILFVKPLAPSAVTNMTVVTNQRTYLFDLVASPRNAPLYVMQFRYPKLEKAKEEARLAAVEDAKKERASEAELAAASDPFAVQDPATLNFQWAAAGERTLLPERTYDNGDVVFLTWPVGVAIPAILVLNDEGEEGPVNFTVRGETIVLERVPTQIILRSGDEAATLTNIGPSPAQARNAQATTQSRQGS